MSNKRQKNQQALQAAKMNYARATENRNKQPKEEDQIKEDQVEAVEEEAVEEVADFIQAATLEEDIQEDTTVVEDEEGRVEVQTASSHIEEARAAEVSTGKVNLDQLRGQISSSASIVLDTVLRFMKDAAPGKPLPPTEGAKYISMFWSALKVMFNQLEDRDFQLVYRAVLDLFEQHKEGVFKEERLYRWVEDWPMAETDRLAYRRLTNLMTVTRNAATRRQSLKQLKDWEYILEYGLSEKARNRIRNFYDI